MFFFAFTIFIPNCLIHKWNTIVVINYCKTLVKFSGGPGMSSTGFGNFVEIGPLDLNLTEREYTWVSDFNVLFVDSPVGSGFSYHSSENFTYHSNNGEIGRDLMTFIKSFLNSFETFRQVPLYIFGESYGGKMTVEFAYQLNKVSCDQRARVSLQISTPDIHKRASEFIIELIFAFEIRRLSGRVGRCFESLIRADVEMNINWVWFRRK